MSTCKIAIFSGVRIRNRLTRKEQVSGSSLLLSFRSLSLSAEPREETDLDSLNVALDVCCQVHAHNSLMRP
jgi:hypothetical protein